MTASRALLLVAPVPLPLRWLLLVARGRAGWREKATGDAEGLLRLLVAAELVLLLLVLLWSRVVRRDGSAE